jgi:hypothetical protein
VSQRWVVTVMLWATLAGLAAFAPSAGANSHPKGNHFRMLPFRPCNGVLVAADFLDGLEEISPTSVTSAAGTTAAVSICKYASTEEGAALGHIAEFTNGALGVECLANAFKLIEKTGAAPPGGCYRIANATVLFARGRAVERLASKLEKGVKSKIWPGGYGRYVVPGIGNRAEIGYNGARDGYGYLQVDNATVIVETSEGGSLIKLLRDAASTL